ncbi:hypothetical protein OH809_16860 [Streptomyces sp. NBC_00873]|uniref:hypothetical protein n=1 Tax=unclassified Streptomyces TaxID=2593676 RepID=UPI00386D7549|nr:hypothetical protein OH809_16860 [Streptomyces sp. NBC_00873]WTA45789.1 hypothetical protein OH821_26825 [Streptomyces sp. NBC_00842]
MTRDLSFYKSPLSEEIRDEGRVEGRVEGLAYAILAILEERGFDVPDKARERITGCGNLDAVRQWLLRAPAASSIEDIFA